jgi:hypothetical protein
VIADQNRMNELEHMLRRMGAVSSVFRVRSEVIGTPGFLAFSELMDAYIELCRRNVIAKNDYTKDPLMVDDQARSEITAAFTKVFGQDPAAFLRPPAPRPETK